MSKIIKLNREDSITIDQGFERFLRWCKLKGFSEYTIEFYDEIRMNFARFKNLDETIEDLNMELFEEYILFLQKTDVASVSIFIYTKGLTISILKQMNGGSNMKKRLSIILCIALIICIIPTTSAFAAKKVKTKSVSVAPKSMTLMVGDIAQLNATKKPSNSTDKLTWTSSDKAVATVSSKGVVQGVSEGTATITVNAGTKKATCTVVVKKFVDEDELREKIKEELKDEFATKNDIQSMINENTYTKSEIDSKISEIPKVATDGFATKEEVQTVSQNTYTKSEIDEKISNISYDFENQLPTSGNVILHSGQKMTFMNNGKTFTVTDVNITKSPYNDMADFIGN